VYALKKQVLIVFGTVVALWIVGCQITDSSVKDNDLISACEFANPNQITGKNVWVTGKLDFTMHGVALYSDSCPSGMLEGAVLLFPGEPNTPSVEFQLDARALEVLGPFFRVSGGEAIACATIKGKFLNRGVSISSLVRRILGVPRIDGFGPVGSFSNAFVIQSVREVKSCP
jgi:hypothetical protein